MKKRKVGILYDNISRNTGDLAIGLSVKYILSQLGLKSKDYVDLIPGFSDTNRCEKIIIGGGLLLRPKGDPLYDKFKIRGRHILNSVGIDENPLDLDYLNKYRYLSVRSTGDKAKLSYLKKDVRVVPCTTMLLKDTKVNVEIKKNAVGIHCYQTGNDIKKCISDYLPMINILKKNYTVYLLPITHYNYDYEFQNILSKEINSSRIIPLPKLKPLEIFSLIGKFKFFASQSLHGAIFSYVHNIPFILWSKLDYDEKDKKMRYFMHDRNLENYLFQLSDIKSRMDLLLDSRPDYSKNIAADLKKLQNHINRIGEILV